MAAAYYGDPTSFERLAAAGRKTRAGVSKKVFAAIKDLNLPEISEKLPTSD